MLKKHLGFIFNLLSIALFIPGILLPMFSFQMTVQAKVSQSTLSSEFINKELSLIATIEELWRDERLLVAFLIFAFSIAIPLIKSFLLAFAYYKKHQPIEQRIYNWVSKISKWSMADVFVVAIFLAILSTNHAQTSVPHQLSVFGFKVPVMMSSETLSYVGNGFYYFTAYCLISLLATQLSQSSLSIKSKRIE